MTQQRLLKRVATWQQGKHAGQQSNLPEAVLVDIENVLNCQQGNVLINSAMGLKNLQGHFHSHTAPDLAGLGGEISAQITEFETRLKNVSVLLDEDNQDFTHFIWRLQATFVGNNVSSSISAYIKINATGRVTVESAM